MNTKDTLQGLNALRTILVIGAVFVIGVIGVYVVSVLKPLTAAKEIVDGAYETAKQSANDTYEAAKEAVEDTREGIETTWEPLHETTGLLLPWNITLSGIKQDTERLYGIVDKTGDIVSGRWAYDSIVNTSEVTKNKLQEYWGKVF